MSIPHRNLSHFTVGLRKKMSRPKRKSTQPIILDKLKRVKADPTHPNDAIHLNVESEYSADNHPFFDTKWTDKLKMEIRKRAIDIKKFDDSKLTMEQTNVRDGLLDAASTCIVTGEAGSGKTYVQMSLIKRLKENKENVFRIGPTHGSVANLPNDSCTYQTFFSMPPKHNYLDHELSTHHVKEMRSAAMRQPFIQRAKHRQEISTLIIEEAGMISCEVIDLIFSVLDVIAPNRFRVFLFFDILQLAPVEGNSIIESDNVKHAQTFVLRTNMRQTGDEEDFLDLLRATAKNNIDDSHYVMLQSRRVGPYSQVATRKLCARNTTVDAHNLAHLNSLTEDVYTYRALDIAIKKMPDYGLARSTRWVSWGIGAKIVFESTPLHEVGLYNGVTGTIIDTVATDTDMILPVVCVDKYDMKIVVHPYTEEILTEVSGATAPTVQAHRTQFPFSIADATTVHKVQGLTLDCPVEIDFKDMTSPGQIYTALSRLTRLEYLTIKNLPPNKFNGGMEGLRVSDSAKEWCEKVGL